MVTSARTFVHMPPQTMSISKFKATCLAVLERVRATGQPVLVTKFGTPVAQVLPPTPPAPPPSWLGVLRERGRIVNDLVGLDLPSPMGGEP
jgi:prevent-host-death family protein